MANFFDVLKDVIAILPADKAGELISSLKTDNELVAQVNSMLNQVRNDPASAGQVATAIIGMRGVPGAVRDMVGRLPKAASDPSGLALEMLITSIQSQMSQRRGWFG
jgi:hypothetical protein